MNGVTELKNLLRQKTWDKDVVLWLGSDAALKDALSLCNAQELDILDLFDPDNLPANEEDAHARLTNSLRQHLQGLQPTARSKIVLVVRSGGLLARYNLGLKSFYDWFCGDFGMVIIALARAAEKMTWPAAVVFDDDRLYDYFTGMGMCSRVITDKG
jgi:hypothetical protein